ncbi:MAG: glycoside hydrolase family 127 protein [Bacillota bacterium]|nr:glycoside hydrolase family 127 protein [Bacillota bacterium]
MHTSDHAFTKMDFADIKPTGWLKNQLQIQADGLSGHLHEFWPDIADSQWIGGKADGWERVPYWLDGYIPLAYLLQDKDMIDVALSYVNAILDQQSADGFLCPAAVTDRSRYDVWSVFLILKVLVLFHDITGDSRIEPCVARAFEALSAHLDQQTLFNWGQMRWFECLIPLGWLYQRRQEDWILRLYQKLATQGFDWKGLFRDWPYKAARKSWGWDNHVVNNAMVVKAGQLMWQFSGDVEDRALPERMYRLLMDYHGMATGVFSGDECLAGQSPVQGTELCAVVELMYSFEELLQLTGDPVWGDRLERVAFNALPATFSPDMWTHQYDQQVNQVQCSKQENPVFFTNGSDANLFGLEPNYGCCTANLSQGWPKLTRHTFFRDDEGFVSAVLAPSRIESAYQGKNLSIELVTDYPFSDELKYIVHAEEPVNFSLKIRIPAWAEGARLTWNGRDGHPDEQPVAGCFHAVRATWSGRTDITVKLPMQPQLESRPGGLFAVTRGPLVYALPVQERWVLTNTELPYREYPHCDYEVYPESAWNYGLIVDEQDLAGGISFEQKPVGQCPFSPDGAPVVAHVKARKVAWTKNDGVCAPAPDLSQVSEETEEIRLIPYGCTNLRLTEMPLLEMPSLEMPSGK